MTMTAQDPGTDDPDSPTEAGAEWLPLVSGAHARWPWGLYMGLPSFCWVSLQMLSGYVASVHRCSGGAADGPVLLGPSCLSGASGGHCCSFSPSLGSMFHDKHSVHRHLHTLTHVLVSALLFQVLFVLFVLCCRGSDWKPSSFLLPSSVTSFLPITASIVELYCININRSIYCIYISKCIHLKLQNEWFFTALVIIARCNMASTLLCVSLFGFPCVSSACFGCLNSLLSFGFCDFLDQEASKLEFEVYSGPVSPALQSIKLCPPQSISLTLQLLWSNEPGCCHINAPQSPLCLCSVTSNLPPCHTVDR